MGRVVHKTSCLWGGLSIGQVVMGRGRAIHEANCHGTRFLWGKLSWGEQSWGELQWGELQWGELSGNLTMSCWFFHLIKQKLHRIVDLYHSKSIVCYIEKALYVAKIQSSQKKVDKALLSVPPRNTMTMMKIIFRRSPHAPWLINLQMETCYLKFFPTSESNSSNT